MAFPCTGNRGIGHESREAHLTQDERIYADGSFLDMLWGGPKTSTAEVVEGGRAYLLIAFVSLFISLPLVPAVVLAFIGPKNIALNQKSFTRTVEAPWEMIEGTGKMIVDTSILFSRLHSLTSRNDWILSILTTIATGCLVSMYNYASDHAWRKGGAASSVDFLRRRLMQSPSYVFGGLLICQPARRQQVGYRQRAGGSMQPKPLRKVSFSIITVLYFLAAMSGWNLLTYKLQLGISRDVVSGSEAGWELNVQPRVDDSWLLNGRKECAMINICKNTTEEETINTLMSCGSKVLDETERIRLLKSANIPDKNGLWVDTTKDSRVVGKGNLIVYLKDDEGWAMSSMTINPMLGLENGYKLDLQVQFEMAEDHKGELKQGLKVLYQRFTKSYKPNNTNQLFRDKHKDTVEAVVQNIAANGQYRFRFTHKVEDKYGIALGRETFKGHVLVLMVVVIISFPFVMFVLIMYSKVKKIAKLQEFEDTALVARTATCAATVCELSKELFYITVRPHDSKSDQEHHHLDVFAKKRSGIGSILCRARDMSGEGIVGECFEADPFADIL